MDINIQKEYERIKRNQQEYEKIMNYVMYKKNQLLKFIFNNIYKRHLFRYHV